MIDVHDLCIGNWVYDGDKTQFPMFIRAVGEDYIYLDFEGNEGDLWETTPEDLQGIPLTDDIMERCGFILKDGLWRRGAVKVKPESSFVSVEYQSNGWLRTSANSTEIYYLHQLQNFVYVTTRQQLKVGIWQK